MKEGFKPTITRPIARDITDFKRAIEIAKDTSIMRIKGFYIRFCEIFAKV